MSEEEEEEVPEEELEEYVEEMEEAEKKPDSEIGEAVLEGKKIPITSCHGLDESEINTLEKMGTEGLKKAIELLRYYSEYCLINPEGKRKVRAPSEWNLFYKRYCAPAAKKIIESEPGSEYIKEQFKEKELSKPAKGRIMMRTCGQIYHDYQTNKTETIKKLTGAEKILYEGYEKYFKNAVDEEKKKQEELGKSLEKELEETKEILTESEKLREEQPKITPQSEITGTKSRKKSTKSKKT